MAPLPRPRARTDPRPLVARTAAAKLAPRRSAANRSAPAQSGRHFRQRNRTTAAGHHQRHHHQSKPHPRIVARPRPRARPPQKTATRRPKGAARTPPGIPLWTPRKPPPPTPHRLAPTSLASGASVGDYLPARPRRRPAGRGHTWTVRSIIRTIHEQIVAIYWQGSPCRRSCDGASTERCSETLRLLQVRHRKR